MRTGLIIALILLTVTLGAGLLEEKETRMLAERYISAAAELRLMAEAEDWQRASDTVSAYLASWRQAVPWLQILINHEDIDDVTLALVRLEASIAAKEQSSCFEACAELKENASHIYHRDAFSLGNVL